jgi:hypothetical protein
MNQRTLLGLQTSANTPVAATTKLRNSSFSLSPQAEFNENRPEGERITASSTVNKEWTEISMQGQADYNELTYPLAMMFNYAAPSGTNEKTWTFESDMDCRDISKQFSLWKGDSCVRGDFTHDVQAQSGSLTFARDGITQDFTLIGKQLEKGVSQVQLSITGSPTGGTFTITYNEHTTTDLTYDDTAADIQAALIALADFTTGDIECLGGDLPSNTVTILVKNNDIVDADDFSTTDSLSGGTDPASAFADPTETEILLQSIEPADVDIYFADTQAGLDAADAAERNLQVTFNYNGKITPLFVLNSTYGTSWKEHIETLADIGVSFQVVADSEGEAFFDTMRDGDVKFMRIEAVGAVIGTDMGGTSTANYTFSGDFAFLINSAPSFEDADGAYVNTWAGVIADDTTWGKGYSIELINAVASL